MTPFEKPCRVEERNMFFTSYISVALRTQIQNKVELFSAYAVSIIFIPSRFPQKKSIRIPERIKGKRKEKYNSDYKRKKKKRRAVRLIDV